MDIYLSPPIKLSYELAAAQVQLKNAMELVTGYSDKLLALNDYSNRFTTSEQAYIEDFLSCCKNFLQSIPAAPYISEALSTTEE